MLSPLEERATALMCCVGREGLLCSSKVLQLSKAKNAGSQRRCFVGFSQSVGLKVGLGTVLVCGLVVDRTFGLGRE